MYAFLDRVDADAFEAIAAQAYVEMAKAGYASVAEFHYVHHDSVGKPFADPAELAWRVVAAARAAGVGLTLLPVFYAHAGFGGTPTTAGQRRFAHTTYTFTHLYERLQQGISTHGYVLGVAPHSLRAVTPEEMGHVVRLAAADAPVHIHAAEQTKEVDDCFAWSRLRPVEWLLTQASVDARWCIVHATHMTEKEVAALAASGAVAGLAPTTEADLGDGTFPGHAYLVAGGRFGVGSDSNTIVDPFAELRQFEWSQRMRMRRRNVLGSPGDAVDRDDALGERRARRRAGGGAAGRRARSRSSRRPGGAQSCRSGAGRTGGGRRPRRCRSSARPAIPCATSWRAASGSSATDITRPRKRPSPATAPRLRASTPDDDAGSFRPAAGGRARGHDARRRRALRRDSRRRDRRERRHHRVGGPRAAMFRATSRHTGHCDAADDG